MVWDAILRSWGSSPKARSSTARPRVTVMMCSAAEKPAEPEGE